MITEETKSEKNYYIVNIKVDKDTYHIELIHIPLIK